MNEYATSGHMIQEIFAIPKNIWAKEQLAQILPGIERYAASVIGTLQLISVTISLILFFSLIIISLKKRALNAPQETVAEQEPQAIPTPATGGAYAARWGEILRHMDSAKEAEWKLAIIEADKLLDLVLQRSGFPGGTIGERLTNIQPGQVQTLEGAWFAHKIRNRIAHDMDYFLRYTEAKQAIEYYAQTLVEFEAI
jgi:hypothetical protein